jgi:hypothetical protein
LLRQKDHARSVVPRDLCSEQDDDGKQQGESPICLFLLHLCNDTCTCTARGEAPPRAAFLCFWRRSAH